MTPQSTWRKIDDYPLFVMDTYEDYHFDRYLKTGILPLPPGFSLPAGGCSCFSAFNLPDQAIFGRNYDWTKNIPILLLFTHPANGYASASMVARVFLWALGQKNRHGKTLATGSYYL